MDVLTQKFHGVPGWLILLVAAGAGYYIISRRSSSATPTDTSGSSDGLSGDLGSSDTTGGYYFVPAVGTVDTTGTGTGNAGGGSGKNHPAPKHTVSDADRAAQIMKDYAKNHNYFKTHPTALQWLRTHAPGRYKTLPTSVKTGHAAAPAIHPTAVSIRGSGRHPQQPHVTNHANG